MKSFDVEQVCECLGRRMRDNGAASVRREMEQLQVAVYVMAGGGFVGRSLAEQPDGAYVDDRASKRAYSLRKIMQAVKVLGVYRDVLGLDKLPALRFDCHNCGVW